MGVNNFSLSAAGLRPPPRQILADQRTACLAMVDPRGNPVLQVSLFAELFNEMLQRDFGYRIYKALAAIPVKDEKKEKEKKVKKEAEKKELEKREIKKEKEDDGDEPAAKKSREDDEVERRKVRHVYLPLV